MAELGTFSWVDEHPAVDRYPDQDGSHATYRPRRAHTKSRKGCQNCKKRRIKCDESRPKCMQCVNRAVPCDFIHSPPSSESSQQGRQLARGDVHRNTGTSMRQQMMLSLEAAKIPWPSPNNAYWDEFDLLGHFFEATEPWIGSPECQKVLQQHGLQLSFKAPYLLHAILAFSARHLSFLHPDEKKYGLAASFYYDVSLASYSAQIRGGLDANNADAIVGCGYLHTMLAFHNVQSEEHADGGVLTWVRTMQGVRILWATENIGAHLMDSPWYSVCIESKVAENFTCDHLDSKNVSSGTEKTCYALHQLLEVDLSPGGPGNKFQDSLSRLCTLINSDTWHDKIGMFIAFIGLLPDTVVQLLDGSDPKAMLILCYWCALFSQIDKWWISRSAHVECMRLCAYLNKMPDQRIRDLLQFPASKCGYLASQPNPTER